MTQVFGLLPPMLDPFLLTYALLCTGHCHWLGVKQQVENFSLSLSHVCVPLFSSSQFQVNKSLQKYAEEGISRKERERELIHLPTLEICNSWGWGRLNSIDGFFGCVEYALDHLFLWVLNQHRLKLFKREVALVLKTFIVLSPLRHHYLYSPDNTVQECFKVLFKKWV